MRGVILLLKLLTFLKKYAIILYLSNYCYLKIQTIQEEKKMTKIPEGIFLKTPDGVHNTFGIEIYMPSNPEKVAEFEAICKTKLWNNPEVKDFLGTFFQGNSDKEGWKYFEFLKTHPGTSTENQDRILAICKEIADELGMELN